MSKTPCYKDSIKSMIIEIRQQINQSYRKNRFIVQEIRKYDNFEIKSNLLSVQGNNKYRIRNSYTQNHYSRIKEINRRFTIQPLKRYEVQARKDHVLNKEKLMIKKKWEIHAWTIITTNQTD